MAILPSGLSNTVVYHPALLSVLTIALTKTDSRESFYTSAIFYQGRIQGSLNQYSIHSSVCIHQADVNAEAAMYQSWCFEFVEVDNIQFPYFFSTTVDQITRKRYWVDRLSICGFWDFWVVFVREFRYILLCLHRGGGMPQIQYPYSYNA